MTDLEASFHHTGISVRDMDRAKAFYCGKLGFSVLWEHKGRTGEPLQKVVGLPGAVMDITMLEGYGTRVELFKYIQPEGKDLGERRQCDFGLIHFALKVKDARAAYAKLVKEGVRFISPPQDVRSGVTAMYLHDDEGNTIELIENNID